MNISAPRGLRRVAQAAVTTVSSLSLLAACQVVPGGETPAGTSDAGEEAAGSATESSSVSTASALVAEASSVADVAAAMAENHDYWTTEESQATEQTIDLETDTATTDSDSVTVDGNTVTIAAAGTYRVSGTLDGQLVVDAGDEDQIILIFDGVAITHDSGPAVLLRNADGVRIDLAVGTSNSVTDTDTYAEDAEEDAAIFADTDLQITGTGALEVTGRGADGIASKKDLVIESGEITVEAVGHGVRGKDALVITGGTLTVEAGGDALRSNNDEDADRGYVLITGGSLELVAEQDGIDAASDLLISGGTVNVQSGGGVSTTALDDVSSKGLKAGVLLMIDDGEATVSSADDALHSNGSIRLNGGTVIAASGDDGAHADDTLLIDGVSLTITESYEGLEATYLLIEDGDLDITATDDGLNGTNNLEETSGEATDSAPGGPGGMGGEMADDGSLVRISGGTLTVDAEGDGIDSNGTLHFTGGTTYVFGTTRGGNGAFDSNGAFSIDGGTVMATSAGQMEQTPTSGEQGWLATAISGNAGDTVAVGATSGSELGSLTPAKDYGYVFYSDETIAAGETYSVATAQDARDVTAGDATSAGMGTGMPGGMTGGMPGGPQGTRPDENMPER